VKRPPDAVTAALIAAAAFGLARPRALAAPGENPGGRAPGHQLSLELVPLAGALGYALGVGPNASLGVKAGFGFDVAALIPVAGRHFTDDWGLAYEERDGTRDKKFTEIGQLAVYLRYFWPGRWHMETGVRLVGGSHADSSDDDSAEASFVGAYGALFWGGAVLSIGARVSAGRFHEPHGSGATELGVLVTPIILKLATD
jgi:hypothetical protein